MDKKNQIEAIVDFVGKHPQTVASRRICREVLGEGMERSNQEFSSELTSKLGSRDEEQISSYYYLIR
ncbi:MAG TPA: hypothetical protein VF531_02405 [Bacillota bacterium]